jgi:transcriptional regulator with XRE-family HTH domain
MVRERRPGHLWAIVEEWMDSMSYPPSGRKLAQRIGVSHSALTGWKFGESFPSVANLHALAAEIGVPYERLLDAVLIDQGYRQPPGARSRASSE